MDIACVDARACVCVYVCSWFELEWAEAQIRAGKTGRAMKKAMAVHTHFEDFVEDQFDFHTYCMRKVHHIDNALLFCVSVCVFAMARHRFV